MSKFLHDADDEAKAMALTQVFSKNSRAKNKIAKQNTRL